MNILWLTWKDTQNPLAGGAELVNEELAKRLTADGHSVKLLVGGYKGAKTHETVDGYEIIRVGNRFSVYWLARSYYKTHLNGWPELVIDEINTIPFFAKFYVREPSILFIHMLCREIWFHELPKPLGLIGYILEPLYLRSLSDRQVITVSTSTKHDLMRFGFKPGQIKIVSEGIKLKPTSRLTAIKKYDQPTLLSLGSIRSMKRTLDQVAAFELAKTKIPELKLIIAGPAVGSYGNKLTKKVSSSRFAKDISYMGRVSEHIKVELMQRSHVALQTAVKEGWGLTVTEAASQGTPSVVYNSDGLRDSVRHNQTGLVVRPDPKSLAEAVCFLLADPERYDRLRTSGWEWSKQVTFEKSYADMKSVLTPYTEALV